MLSSVMGGEKVAVAKQKLSCRGSGNSGLSWSQHAAALLQRCWNKTGNGLELFSHMKTWRNYDLERCFS